jgi:UDP-N-acetyl-D-glucosamine dehydrogenase
VGVTTQFIELAGQVNRSMPEYVVHRTMLALNEHRKAIKGSRILLLGMAYKPNVDDKRESPTFALMDRFADLGADVAYHDPYIPEIGPTREHGRWQGLRSIPWSREEIAACDAVVIATNHQSLNRSELAAWAGLVIDTRDAMRGITGRASVVKA